MLVKGWSLTEAGTGDDQLSAERAARLETACKRWKRWMQLEQNAEAICFTPFKYDDI